MAKKVKPKQSTGLNLQPNQNSTLSSGTISSGAISSSTMSYNLFSFSGINQTPIFTINNSGTIKAGSVVLPDDFEIMVDYFKYIMAHLNIELAYTYEDFIKMGKDGYKGILESIIRDVKLKKLINEK
mgnify:CR=1